MITMPGLPMFGHGQIEGFEEKYGMEYMRSYRDESPDQYLIDRHNHEIFPLLKKRYLFAGVEDFLFYDVWNNGSVNENVFAYSNRCGSEYTLVFYNNKYERAAGWIKQSCEYAVKTGSGENDKKLVSRSLSEGLGLNAQADSFVIFYEQRSAKWYIRRSKDICEQGMFIALNGFETQVFMNIEQKKDIDGKLEELCNFLNGSGTPDLKIAWQELHFKEIYEKFGILLDKTVKFFEESKKPSCSKLKLKIEAPLSEFYKTAEKFAPAKTKIKIPAIKLAPVQKKDGGLRLKKQILILLEPLSKTGLCLNWNLHRKIAEKIEGSYRFFEKAFIFKSAKIDELSLARLLVNSEYSRNLTGTNEFDGVKWFNKEMMENALKEAEEILLEGKSKALTEKIKKIFKNLDSAQKKSEYKCENFLKTFAPKKKKTAKAAKKDKTSVKTKKKTAKKE